MLGHGPKSQHGVRGGRSQRRKGPDMSTVDPVDADSQLSAFHERRQIQSKIKYFQSWLSGNHLKNVKNQIYRQVDQRKPTKPALLNPALGKFASQLNQSKTQGLQDAAFRVLETAAGISSAEATGFCEPKLKIEGAKANARYAESADASNIDASDPRGASLGPPSIDATAQEALVLQKAPQEQPGQRKIHQFDLRDGSLDQESPPKLQFGIFDGALDLSEIEVKKKRMISIQEGHESKSNGLQLRKKKTEPCPNADGANVPEGAEVIARSNGTGGSNVKSSIVKMRHRYDTSSSLGQGVDRGLAGAALGAKRIDSTHDQEDQVGFGTPGGV